MREPYRAGSDVVVLPSALPIPGAGLQPTNAFLLRSPEPMLIDTGMPVDREEFLAALWNLVDPQDLRWVVVTHDDRDHTGALAAILAAAPRARLLTNGVSLIRLTEEFDLPVGRVLQANPGQRVEVAGRRFSLLRPPVFDSPGTVALLDETSGTLFSSDCFGTILPQLVDTLVEAPVTDFIAGFEIFHRAIAPWTALVDRARFAVSVAAVQALRPERVLSSHGPVADGPTDFLFDALDRIPQLPPWLPASDLDAALDQFEAGTAGSPVVAG